jgi:uncharacterized protein
VPNKPFNPIAAKTRLRVNGAFGYTGMPQEPMTTNADLFYVTLIVVAWPLFEYFFFWPAFLRGVQTNRARAWAWLWFMAILLQWSLVALGAALWVRANRSWASLGFSTPEGWRWWVSIALFVLLAAYYAYAIVTVTRSSVAKASMRQQFGKLAVVMPRTRSELYLFGGASLTAGFCEEFLYRGYIIWLFAPWLGWWGAAALSVPFFASIHAYQGWNGMIRTGVLGALFVLMVALLGSLWPAIALHVVVDLGAGILAWLALRESQLTDGIVEAELQTENAIGVEAEQIAARHAGNPRA